VRSPLRFSASSARSLRGVARAGGRSGWVVRSSLTCRTVFRTRVCDTPPVTLSSIEKTRSPVVLRSAARVGSVKPTRLEYLTLAGDPSVRALLATRRLDLAARAGSCTDASFSAVFRYPLYRVSRAALPDERSFPLRDRTPDGPFRRILRPPRVASSGGAPGVLSLRRFHPTVGWSRGSSTAATLHSDISVRPGPRVVRAGSSASRFIFAGMTGRRLVNTSELKRRSVVRMIWLRLLGFDSRLRSAARSTRPRSDPALGFASCRVDGHMTVHRERPRRSPRITSLREPTARTFFGGRASPIRSWV